MGDLVLINVNLNSGMGLEGPTLAGANVQQLSML
jgi:hypothetical protein